jgi:hypothetical protein
MKKAFCINLLIDTAIMLFLVIGCKKEKTSGDIEYKITHWPEVTTLEVTNLTSTTATLLGSVNGFGLSTTVTFEYDTSSSEETPTSYSNTITAYQSPVTVDGITIVSADISGLTECPIYHYRIKAENSKWINFYGSDQHFFIVRPPTLTTIPVSGITATTAIVGGNITDDGGSAVTERGVFWAPDNGQYFGGPGVRTLKNDSTGTGIFTCILSGLRPNTSYYVESYAKNCLLSLSRSSSAPPSLGRGNLISFTTSH